MKNGCIYICFVFIPGEHCETYVKHFQTLFSDDNNTAL